MKECITLILNVKEFQQEIETETGVKIWNLCFNGDSTTVNFDIDSVVKLFMENDEYDPSFPNDYYDTIYTINFDIIDTISNRYGANTVHLITDFVVYDKIYIILEE